MKKPQKTSLDFLAITLNSNRSCSDSTGNGNGLRTTYDITPVTLANAHYLGVDLGEGTRVPIKRQGIGIIVHGPLASIRKGECQFSMGMFDHFSWFRVLTFDLPLINCFILINSKSIFSLKYSASYPFDR